MRIIGSIPPNLRHLGKIFPIHAKDEKPGHPAA
jgi:hypothetical protein